MACPTSVFDPRGTDGLSLSPCLGFVPVLAGSERVWTRSLCSSKGAETRRVRAAAGKISLSHSPGSLHIHSRKTLLGILLSGLMASSIPTQAAEQPISSRALIQRGMEYFRVNEVEKSVADFDRSIDLEPNSADYLWQRGLSLYYVDKFGEAADQFLRDVKLNPRDTEESIWRLISQARQAGSDFNSAQKSMIPIEGETRPYMRIIYDVFAGRKPVAELEGLAQSSFQAMSSQNLFADRSGAIRTNFYTLLYLGLFYEAKGDESKAKKYITESARSPYSSSGDYMYSLAVVHCNRRGWNYSESAGEKAPKVGEL